MEITIVSFYSLNRGHGPSCSVLVCEVKSDVDISTPPSALCRIFEDDRSGLVARLRHEELQPPLLSVSPEGRKVSFAGPDEEEGEDELEGEVLDENRSHHP